ncbi:MAG TPA: radical SAM protein [Micropepsaceae bacterium]|nr:radical SAM protein [Micropepsaceae bacterium]
MLQSVPLREKFVDPDWTASGEARARVAPAGLKTLWFNTGTLCNIACRGCYIESTPRNDRLAYLSYEEARTFMAEAARDHPALRDIGFTGGEPFMNPDIIAMLMDSLGAGYRTLVLTNAMKPMRRHEPALLELKHRYSHQLSVRVSLDHFTEAKHEAIRGRRSWRPALEGLRWLSRNGFDLAVASRMLWPEDEAAMRSGFGALFAENAIAIEAWDPHRLVLFPEMDDSAAVPEVTERCWAILNKNPDQMMCAHSRMVIKRAGAAAPAVVSCTLHPYDDRFEMGVSLADANRPVSLNHPRCAKFCVLGGASCSA